MRPPQHPPPPFFSLPLPLSVDLFLSLWPFLPRMEPICRPITHPLTHRHSYILPYFPFSFLYMPMLGKLYYYLTELQKLWNSNWAMKHSTSDQTFHTYKCFSIWRWETLSHVPKYPLNGEGGLTYRVYTVLLYWLRHVNKYNKLYSRGRTLITFQKILHWELRSHVS